MAPTTSSLNVYRMKFHVFVLFCIFLVNEIIICSNAQAIPDASVPNGQSDGIDEEAFHSEPIELEEIRHEINEPTERDFYSFSVRDIAGTLVSLEKYRGKVTLVVNVASACGFTDSHYKALIRLKNVLSTTNKFEILAFPCNQFGAQEPGTNAEIQEWAEDNYHVNFPLFSKINVLDDNVPEAWQYLIDKSGKAPNWNFWKYLVNEKGSVIDAWGPRVPVEDLFHIIREHVEAVKHVQPSQQPSAKSSQRVVSHDKSDSVPNWNFWKYLVDEDGHVTRAWGPWDPVEDIFHDIKEAVDLIGYEKETQTIYERETQIPPHGGEL